MIIARSAGRLGNQLFVYAALAKVRNPTERVVLVGFQELRNSFPTLSTTCQHVSLARKDWWKWDLVLATLRLASTLRITQRITSAPAIRQLVRSRGLTPITLFDGGFCQDEKLLDQEVVASMLESPEIFQSDNRNETGANGGRENFFVHVRRGDYLVWPSPETPAVLPDSWYESGMKQILKSFPSAQFLVFSDDEEYAANLVAGFTTAKIIQSNPAEALLTMAGCRGGILSASSLSWWAARLASIHSSGPFIAPLHWISWPHGGWDTSHSLQDTSFLTWVPVSPA